MIINHEHRFVYFSIPRTASTATAQHLIDSYGSEQVGKKHSTYREFEADSTPDELTYFKLAAIRNPLDSVVSEYFKKKSNHKNKFSRKQLKNGRQISDLALRKHEFITSGNSSFANYFKEFYKEEYRRPQLEHTLKHADMIMRFETLNDDFNRFTTHVGVPYAPIGIQNQTAERNQSFLMYYTDDIIPQAKRIFGRYMKEYGYSLPTEW